jgi:hypothetical protein
MKTVHLCNNSTIHPFEYSEELRPSCIEMPEARDRNFVGVLYAQETGRGPGFFFAQETGKARKSLSFFLLLCYVLFFREWPPLTI